MAHVKGKTQIGCYIDEKLWKDFKKRVFEKTGKLEMSKFLEEAIELWIKK